MNLIKDKLFYDTNCLSARIQRFKRGYSYGDVWNMDQWFMRTVKPMLIHLRDHGMGIPWDLYKEEGDEREDWEDILSEMIGCLDLMDEDAAAKYLEILEDDHSAESYQRVSAFMESCKERFFELFSQHFYSLWD